MHAHPGHIELLFKGAKLLEEGLEVGVALEKSHVVLLSEGHGWELLHNHLLGIKLKCVKAVRQLLL